MLLGLALGYRQSLLVSADGIRRTEYDPSASFTGFCPAAIIFRSGVKGGNVAFVETQITFVTFGNGITYTGTGSGRGQRTKSNGCQPDLEVPCRQGLWGSALAACLMFLKSWLGLLPSFHPYEHCSKYWATSSAAQASSFGAVGIVT